MSTSALRLTRRQALGLAVAGAGAAAGARMLAVRLGGPSGDIASAAGLGGAWRSPLDQPRAQAAHLLRRAGLGPSSSELDAAASLSYGDLVDSLLAQQPEAMATPPHPTAHASVVQAWYEHMAVTRSPFPERMALFWHSLLTSDYRKAAELPFVLQQNALYRDRGRGDLRTLLGDVTVDPLMMRYLDLDRSTGSAPNENFSRELMELFTMGVGNYTETDVREGARALAGLRIQLRDRSGQPIPLPVRRQMTRQQYQAQIEQLLATGASFRGELVERRRDTGSKTFLGRSGDLGVSDVIDAILARDATATFIATKALMYFATPSPSTQLVSSVARSLRSSHYDLRTMMRAILTSDDFRAPQNYRSLVRSPADYMVATMRALGNRGLSRQAVAAGAGMDQVLYDPPTVAGWPSGGGWLSSSSLLARLNFAQIAATSSGQLPDPSTAVRDQLDGSVGSDLAQVFNASSTASDRWYALLGSPEFHLK